MASLLLSTGVLLGTAVAPGLIPICPATSETVRAISVCSMSQSDAPIVPRERPDNPAEAKSEGGQSDDPADGAVVPLDRLPITMVARQSPVRDESVTVALWDDRRVTFNLTTRGKAGDPVEVCRDVKELFGRRFDAAYEQESGDGLVVCYEPAKSAIQCVTFNQAGVRRERELKVPGDLKIAYMGMKGKPLSDEIVMMVSGITPTNKLQLMSNAWDGKTWRGWETVSEDLESEELGQDRLDLETTQVKADNDRTMKPKAASK